MAGRKKPQIVDASYDAVHSDICKILEKGKFDVATRRELLRMLKRNCTRCKRNFECAQQRKNGFWRREGIAAFAMLLTFLLGVASSMLATVLMK